MGITYKINGKSVSREELNASADKRRLKEVFESRQFPGINDDTTFMAGRGTLADQMGEVDANFVASECERIHGVRPGVNTAYLPAIARHAGDIEAFVPQDGAKGHVKRVCEKNGWRCEGSVKVDPVKREEGDPVFKRPSEEDCKFTSFAEREPTRISTKK